jgi:hypothetical protein
MSVCEQNDIGGRLCKHAAAWFVQVGTRKLDGQYSCPQHLNMTCRALYEAGNPRKPALTVTKVSR